MSRKPSLGAAVLIAGLAAPGLASAQTAIVTTDLNLRAGPGPDFEVITAMPGGLGVPVQGCLEGRNWCQVTYEGQTGWAYAEYLAFETGGERVIIAEAGPRIDLPVVAFETTAGVATGATVGAAVGGPVGAVAGATPGAVAPPPHVPSAVTPPPHVRSAVTPPPHVRSYVIEQPVEQVLLLGDVIVGTSLPDLVVLHPIPDYDYRFAYINEHRVLVDPETRRIVHIFG